MDRNLASEGASIQSATRERQSLSSASGSGGGGGDRCGKHAAEVSQSRGVGEGGGQSLSAGRSAGGDRTAGAVRRGGVWRRHGRWSGGRGAVAFRRDRRDADHRGAGTAEVHQHRPNPGLGGRRNQPDWIPDRNADRSLYPLSTARSEREDGLFAGVSGGHRADAAHPLPDFEGGLDFAGTGAVDHRVRLGRAVYQGSCGSVGGRLDVVKKLCCPDRLDPQEGLFRRAWLQYSVRTDLSCTFKHNGGRLGERRRHELSSIRKK